MELLAFAVANCIIIYLLIGVLYGVYFFFRGAAQIDPAIKESKWTVKLLLLSGAIATWPLLITKK